MKRKKLISRVFGGIGNQLFIYALSKSLSHRKNYQLSFDEITGYLKDKYDRTYILDKIFIDVRKNNFSLYKKFLIIVLRYFIYFLSLIFPGNYKYFRETNKQYDPSIFEIKFKSILYIEGYWQNLKYFNSIRHIIIDQIKPELKRISTKENTNLTVAIHLRIFDDNLYTTENIQKKIYFKKAIDHLKKINSKFKFLIFSEKKSFIRLLPKNENFIFYENRNRCDIEDLFYLSKFRYFILSNSTYGWWAAYLSDQPNKYVVVPNQKNLKFRAWNIEGLLPKSWIQL